jgi:ubiquinone biosynthesis protein
MRFIHICWILAKYLIFYKITSRHREIFGARLKLAFEELGITFIKIGQILSMRYDLLSQEDCQALQGLLDNVNPIPYVTIVEILEREYNKPLSQTFLDFEKKPIGSASVSQVHKAKLFDGSVVAVKIKRPKVDNKFFNDIRILKRLARLIELLSVTMKHVQIREMTNYFENWITQDLDFLCEVRNMKLFRKEYHFAANGFRSDLGKQIVPKPFETLCSENIIVMDFIDGIPLTKKSQIAAKPNYDIKQTVKLIVNAPIRYWFGRQQPTYWYQADPHLSNILALPNGDVASIDFGLVAEISHKEASQCRDLVLAVYLQDIDKVLDLVAAMTQSDLRKSAPRIKPDLEVYLAKAQKEGFGFWFMEMAKIMVKHRLKFPLFMTTFGRSYVMTDGLVNTYLPGQTTLDIVGKELQRLAVRQAMDNILKADWLKLAYVFSEKVDEAPELIAKFIDDPLSVVASVAKAVNSAA